MENNEISDVEYWQKMNSLDKSLRGDSSDISLEDVLKEGFYLQNLNDYEKREDGTILKKDRWEKAIRKIAGRLQSNKLLNQEFEILDVVQAVLLNIPQWRDAAAIDKDEWRQMCGEVHLITYTECGEPITAMAFFFNGGWYVSTQDLDQSKQVLNVTQYATQIPLPTV